MIVYIRCREDFSLTDNQDLLKRQERYHYKHLQVGAWLKEKGKIRMSNCYLELVLCIQTYKQV